MFYELFRVPSFRKYRTYATVTGPRERENSVAVAFQYFQHPILEEHHTPETHHN